MSLRHRIAHWLHWNLGHVESRWDGDRLLLGFRCLGCGALLDEFEVPEREPDA